MSSQTIYIVPKNYRNTFFPSLVAQHQINNDTRTSRRVNILSQKSGINMHEGNRVLQKITPAFSTSRICHYSNPIQQQKILQRQNRSEQIRSHPVPLSKRQYQQSMDTDERDDMIAIEEVYNLIGEDCYNQSINAVPRKRERLNNLTIEEKLNRRKMKNRVAAQTARDRKKERSQRLEKAVKNLLSESKRLREENYNLLIENQRLRKEKEDLMSISTSKNSNVESKNFISSKSNGLNVKSVQPSQKLLPAMPLQTPLDSLNTFGSAESINESLPWKQVFKANQTTASQKTTIIFKRLESRKNLFTILFPFLIILSRMKLEKITQLSMKIMMMNFKQYSPNYSIKKIFKTLIAFVTKSSIKKMLSNNKISLSITATKTLSVLKVIQHLQTNRSNLQSHHPSTLCKLLSFQMKRRKTPRKRLNGLMPLRKVNVVN